MYFLTGSEPSMWFLMVIFLVLLPCNAIDECVPSISMSHNGYVHVMSSQSFNLTCTCTCFSANYTIQLLKNKQVLCELSLSKHTTILFLLIPAVQQNDSGRYECRSKPTKVSSSVNLSVVKDTVKKEDNITAPVVSEPTAGVKSTCNPPCSWNAPLWYLLCKMVLFLVCAVCVVLKKSCKMP